jgi:tetratricopeptide (TPR) repeat protein
MAEALEAARRACVQYPGAAAAWSLLGLVLERSGAHDEAAVALQRAVRIEPDDLPLRIRWALFSMVHTGRTEADSAVAGLRRTVELQLRRSGSPLRREALAGQSEQAIVDLAHLYSDVHADPAEARRLIDWGLKVLGTRSKLSALSGLLPAR